MIHSKKLNRRQLVVSSAKVAQVFRAVVAAQSKRNDVIKFKLGATVATSSGGWIDVFALIA